MQGCQGLDEPVPDGQTLFGNLGALSFTQTLKFDTVLWYLELRF